MPHHLFFDLDHTLWDFDANAEETLLDLYDLYKIDQYSDVDPATFVEIYKEINDRLWSLYREHKIDKQSLRNDRFIETFKAIGYTDEQIPGDIWQRYIDICPTKTGLISGAREILDYLFEKYQLHLITNGFAETQRRKLEHSGIAHYFRSLTISEEIGYQKPHPAIFRHALHNAGSKLTQSQHVGDNFEADVRGGLDSGWKVYWLRPEKTPVLPDYSENHPRLVKINSLLELKNHL